jgi:hypothetical protein
MTGSKPSEAATPAVLATTFVCNSGAVHFISQGCTCPRSSR